jgi:hypothetical protein
MAYRTRQIRVDEMFRKELEDIKIERIKIGVDRDKVSDRRLTRAIREIPLWQNIKRELITAPNIKQSSLPKIPKIKGKKGSVFDLVLILGLLFLIPFVFGALGILVSSVHDGFASVGSIAIGNETINVTQFSDNTIGRVDDNFNNYRFIGVCLILAEIIIFLGTNFYIRTHPLMFIPYIFFIGIIVIVSVPLSNAYQTLLQNPQITVILGTSQVSNMLNYWMIYLPITMTVLGFVGAVLLFINITRDPAEQFGGAF